MRDFARFGTIYTIKKRKKHPWNSVTFRKVTLEIYWKSYCRHGCFSRF